MVGSRLYVGSDIRCLYRDIWMSIARRELGTTEIPGDRHEKRILEYHADTTLKATTDEIPWCSAFACWVMEKAGIPSTRNAMARSWLNWGKRLDEPYEGCIAIFRRGSNPRQGHVAFFVSQTPKSVNVLGGNQGNRVAISPYAKTRLIEYREPDFKALLTGQGR